MSETILIAGGFGLPDRNASAIRVIGLAGLLQSLGYDVVVLGKLSRDEPAVDAPAEMWVEGIRCLDIRRPVGNRRVDSYVISAESVEAVLDMHAERQVRAVVAYNYPARGAMALLRACRRRRITPVLDCTEWYGWEGRNPVRNLMRMAGVEIRMRLLTRCAGNVICASSYFAKTLPRQNTIVLPFVLDARNPKWRRPDFDLEERRPPWRLVYSGSPGLGMHKDRLPLLVEVLHRLHLEGCEFHLTIAGISSEHYLAVVPRHADYLVDLRDKLSFLGRITHEQALTLLRSADFSVFFRASNRVANTGFPTKYVEAATLGVPVITNDTSDLGNYLHHGKNGFLAASDQVDMVAATLRCALSLDGAALVGMKRACLERNPFDVPRWQSPMREFLARAVPSA